MFIRILIAMLAALSSTSAGIILDKSFTSLAGPGSASTNYETVNWSSDTTGLLPSTGIVVTTDEGRTGIGSGLNFNSTFHINGLDGNDLSLIGADFNTVDTRGTPTPFSLSFSDPISHFLLYVGRGHNGTAGNNISRGTFSIPVAFEFVIVAAKNSNFLLDGSAALGSTGNSIDPVNGDPQTAGVLLVRRNDAALFSTLDFTLGSGSADAVQFQFAVPTPVPEPSTLWISALVLIAVVGFRSRVFSRI